MLFSGFGTWARFPATRVVSQYLNQSQYSDSRRKRVGVEVRAELRPFDWYSPTSFYFFFSYLAITLTTILFGRLLQVTPSKLYVCLICYTVNAFQSVCYLRLVCLDVWLSSTIHTSCGCRIAWKVMDFFAFFRAIFFSFMQTLTHGRFFMVIMQLTIFQLHSRLIWRWLICWTRWRWTRRIPMGKNILSW